MPIGISLLQKEAFMMIVRNLDHYKSEVAKAKENGTWEDSVNPDNGKRRHGLKGMLRYLSEYGGLEDPTKFQVELYPDSSGLGVVWNMKSGTAGEYKFFMNGGLIFHEAMKDWSVHT